MSLSFTKALIVLFSPTSFVCLQAALGPEQWSAPAMVNLMGQFHWASTCPGIWSNILGVSVREFLDEIDI